jgi:uncharacterized protein (DUF1778 family)
MKTERFEARISAEQKQLFQRAAALTGRSLSDFVVSSAYEAAAQTIERFEVMSLSARDRDALVDALLNPPAPSRRLTEAARRYRKIIG